MGVASSSRIHPTALISGDAQIGPDVEIGPFCVVEGNVRLGPGCVVGPHAHLLGPLVLGAQNQVYSNVVLGGRPQHFKYGNEATGLEIGDRNTFRENVTVHRGTTHSWTTRIGHDNYFMAGSHVAHDCQVGNRCVFANNALLAGHCIIGDGVYISGNSAVAQFCRMGRLSFLSGTSATTKDIPPFIMQQEINVVVGVNIVGMRRAGIPSDQISSMRRVYHIVFLQNLTLPNALAKVETELGSIDIVREFLDFVRASPRGINTAHGRRREIAA